VRDLDSDRLLAAAGGVARVVEEYLKAHPQQSEAVLKQCLLAQLEGLDESERLQTLMKGGGGRRGNKDQFPLNVSHVLPGRQECRSRGGGTFETSTYLAPVTAIVGMEGEHEFVVATAGIVRHVFFSWEVLPK
jgi:hypothetical protein